MLEAVLYKRIIKKAIVLKRQEGKILPPCFQQQHIGCVAQDCWIPPHPN